MPLIGDLEGLWGASGGTFGIEGGAVSADDLDAGPLGEPGRQRVCFTVGQEVDRRTRLDIDEHSAGDTASELSEFVHADHAGHVDGRARQRGDQPQQDVPADRYPKDFRHPGAGPARERKTDRDQRRSQSLGPSAEPAGEPGHLLGERLTRTGALRQTKPTHP
ncbi:hypothetical protein [Streptomyces sp. NL15-2K]|uniref:hypothetical protein n=1 Tax=Streptomyces sp. NL15-2K TaxID=376149 RepID=UPI00209C1C5D|nr:MULTISPECIES: hypothetical protein [Actinomycetes]WKX15852.1 hypothetical protein Q4V64_53535 [Kutzneria buriramensis]